MMKDKSNIPIRDSIGFNLLRGVFSIYIIIAIIVTIIHMITEYFNVKSMIQDDLALYQTTYEQQLSDALWDLEEERIVTISEGIIKLPAVTALEIFDTNKNVIANLSKNKNNDLAKYLIEHKFDIQYRRENESSIVGYGVLYSDKQTIINKLSTGFTLIIINSVIKTLALWGIFLWLVKPMLIKPLESLTANVKNITLEKLDKSDPLINPIISEVRNEIVILSESFYDMKVRLQESLISVELGNKKINTANNYLEQLLQGAQQMLQSKSKKQLLECYTEYLFQGIKKLTHCKINFIYANYLSAQNKVYLSLEYNVNRKKHSIDMSLTHKKTLTKLPKILRNLQSESAKKRGTENEKIVMPFIWKNKLLAIMTVNLPNVITLSNTDYSYLTTLNQLLTLTLKQIDNNQQLENKVQKRTTELEKSHDDISNKAQELERVSYYKTQFLANMSHEIRTPMNGVFGALQLLQQTVEESESKELVATALSSSSMLLTIINDILDFSKIESGKLELELNNVNVERLIEEVTKELQSEANQQNNQLIIQLMEDLQVNWLGDAVRIKQILINIISNAIKFTFGGTIIVRVNSGELGLFIEVDDSGIGMTEKALTCIFNRFEQADNSTTRQYGGTGLGTNIALNLAILMNGNITAKSKIGKGSQFLIFLPLQPVQNKQEVSPLQREKIAIPQLSTTKVLLAEDNAINRKIFNKSMSPTSAIITMATNGEECIELFKNDKPDLIFMDIQMPVMDGITACKLIKQQTNIPIIALTANVMKEDILHYEKAGFDAVLSKPIELEKLYRLCVEYSQEHRA